MLRSVYLDSTDEVPQGEVVVGHQPFHLVKLAEVRRIHRLVAEDPEVRLRRGVSALRHGYDVMGCTCRWKSTSWA
jgi:hypothetical protein